MRRWPRPPKRIDGRILRAASGARADGAAGRDRVRIADGKCEAWASVQSRHRHARRLAQALGMPIENVTVHVPLLGGGFGRKSKCDYAQEAALLSQAMGGAPVKVVWTREDDIQHGYYHAVSASGSRPGWMPRQQVRPGGIAASRRRSCPSFMPDPKHERRSSSGMGVVDMPFAIPNVRMRDRRGDGAHPNRLVPVGLQHPACLRGAVLRRRAGGGGRAETPRTTCSS